MFKGKIWIGRILLMKENTQMIIERAIQKAEKERKAMEENMKRQRMKFIRRIIALSFAMVGLFTMFSFAKGLVDNQYLEKRIDKFEKVKVEVPYGETAWNIQKKLTPNEDTRDMLDLVRYINKRETLGDLKSGEVIIFLKEKE
jgi:cell division protein YceG involved in septum cleavage